MSLQKVPGYKDCYTVGWVSHDGQGGGRLARKQIKKVVGRAARRYASCRWSALSR